MPGDASERAQTTYTRRLMADIHAFSCGGKDDVPGAARADVRAACGERQRAIPVSD